MKSIDVIIIGGGLAGKSTALHLSKKGFSVLILEKDADKNIIPCAGGMASSVKKFLPIDLSPAIETEVRKVHFTWEFTDNVIAELKGESPFLIIKREVLEKSLLLELLKTGTEIVKPISVENIKKEHEKWIISCKDKLLFKSKILVVADGSESKWSTFLKMGPPKPKYAQTIAMRLNGLGNISKDSVRFDFGSIKYGFAWAFPSLNSTNIGLGTFIGNYGLNNKLVNNKIIKNFGFQNFNKVQIQKKLRIWNGFHNLHNEGALVVGDAASLCDPFLAEGIRPSLMSSYYAARQIDDYLASNDNQLVEYTSIMNSKWSRSMIWGQRIAEVFYRFPRTGYRLGVKRKTAPQRIAQILSGEMSYEDIAKRVIKRLLFQN